MPAPTATEQFINWLTGKPMALFDAIGSIFNPSGANATIGLVPDPGSTPGTTKYLREDATWDVPPGSVTVPIPNSQLADMAVNTIKGRNGPGTGAPEDLTATEATAVLNNFVGDSGSGGTKGLVPAPSAGDAAANKFLNADGTFKTVGAGGATLIASGSLTSTVINVTNIPATYAYLVIVLLNMSIDTDARNALIQVSTNNGSSYDTTSGNYIGFNVNNTPNLSVNSTASLAFHGNIASAATAINLTVSLFNYQGGMLPTSIGHSNLGTNTSNQYSYIGSTSVINAIRFIVNGSGNFDAGTYALYGVS